MLPIAIADDLSHGHDTVCFARIAGCRETVDSLQVGCPERMKRVERRDGRVVEGARLEIALAVCDGVLQISITVAKPTT
jgi:hypothetical protein